MNLKATFIFLCKKNFLAWGKITNDPNNKKLPKLDEKIRKKTMNK